MHRLRIKYIHIEDLKKKKVEMLVISVAIES